MLANLREVFAVLRQLLGAGYIRRRGFALLVVLFTAASLVELASIGSIALIVGVLADAPALIERAARWSIDLSGFDTQQLILVIGLLAIVMQIVNTVVQVLTQWAMVRFVGRNREALAQRMAGGTLVMDYARFRSRSDEEMVLLINNLVHALANSLLATLLQILSTVCLLAFLFLILVAQKPLLVLGVFAVLVLIGLLFLLITVPIQRRTGIELVETQKRTVRQVRDLINGFRETRIFGIGDRWMADYQHVQRRSSEISEINILVMASPRYVFELMLVLTLVALVLYTSYLGIDIREWAATISFAALVVYRIMPQAVRLLTQINSAAHSTKSARVVLDELDHIGDSYHQARRRADALETFDTLRFDDVCYHWDAAQSPILDHVSLAVKQGEHVAIVGPSGSGKSTLIDLLLGLLDPQQGTVSVNHLPMSELRTRWQASCAYVPQQAFLFEGSIAENIALVGRGEAIDRAAIEDAARRMQLGAVLDRNPQGIDASIGPGGNALSGGERQRLALARAIYSRRPVLVLDEATSAMDVELEAKIIDELIQHADGRTLIIVTHRPSVAARCQRTLRVGGGKIESGTA